MSSIFTEIYNLLISLFTGAPAYIEEVCAWVSVALCFFIVAIPFVFIFKIIKIILR